MLALSFFSTETFATALIRAFNGHGTVVILWAWSMFIDNWRMYGLLLTISVSCFIVFSAKVEPGVFLHISPRLHRLETSHLQEQ